jgi:hypothetical protein
MLMRMMAMLPIHRYEIIRQPVTLSNGRRKENSDE